MSTIKFKNPETGAWEKVGIPFVDAYSKSETDALITNAIGTIESINHPGCFYRMINDVQEWLNPPMELGVEYKTTERHFGKPVYTRIIDCGVGPNRTDVETPILNNDVCRPFECTIYDKNGLVITMGSSSLTNDFTYGGTYAGKVRIVSTTDVSSYHFYATIKYTKTTD